jgi:hypothetical protein
MNGAGVARSISPTWGGGSLPVPTSRWTFCSKPEARASGWRNTSMTCGRSGVIVGLRYDGELSYSEIADVLGIPLNTVRTTCAGLGSP